MVRSGDAAHKLGVVIMQVTLVHEHIDHGFVRVVEISAVRPTLATMNLDVDLGKAFECLASWYEDRNLGKPCHVAAGFVELATPAAGAKELISRGRDGHLEPYGLAFIFCNKTSASFLTSRL